MYKVEPAPVDGLREVKRVCDMLDEKYMDPPADGDTDRSVCHQDIHQLIGMCRGMLATLSAMSRPSVVVMADGKAKQES